MTVSDCVTERGNISEGKTPKKYLTSLSIHNISVVTNFFQKFVVTAREVSTRTELSYSK